MHEIQRQLRRVRQTARAMLVLGPVLGWLSIAIALGLALGVLDYLLLLPGWVRLTVGVAATALLVGGLALRVRHALRIRLDETWLALRAERMYPHLSGVLASGVEFAAADAQANAAAATAQSLRTAAMARQSIGRAAELASGVNLLRLIDPAPTLRLGAAATLLLMLTAAIAIAIPSTFWLGARRWVTPLADVHWPKRTGIQSLMTQTYWPSDTPLPLRAQVTRGHRPQMRVQALHRLIDAQGRHGPWQSDLMNDQSPVANDDDIATTDDPASAKQGQFERIIDSFTALARRSGPSQAGPSRFHAVEYQFNTYDDQTPAQRITLVDRPTLVSLTATITPPAYAQGIIEPQTLSLTQTPGQVVTIRGLAGSRITLQLGFNKPLPARTLRDAQAIFPGLAQQQSPSAPALDLSSQSEDGLAQRLQVETVLATPWQSTIQLTDGYGLTSLSQRVYRFEPIEDLPPGVTLLQPQGDESVTAKAVVKLSAIMHDDVASSVLSLHMKRAEAALDEEAAEPAGQAVDTQLHRVIGRAASMEISHELPLQPLSLQAGDVLEVWAAGQDVYMHAGQPRTATRSAVRRITIVDPAAMATRLSQDLDTIRQQALRLEAQQQALIENLARLSTAQLTAQQQVTDRLKVQQQLAQHLQEKMLANQLEDAQLAQLLQKVGEHLQHAAQASEQAHAHLQKAGEALDDRATSNASQDGSQRADKAAADSSPDKTSQDDPQAKAPSSGEPTKSSDSQDKAAAASDASQQSPQQDSQASSSQQQSSGQSQAGAQASAAAADARAQARQQQARTAQELAELVSLLDRGRDAMALQMQLQQMARQQAELSQKTRELLPETLGKRPEQLTPAQRKQLEQLARQQAAMQQQAQAMVQKMQAAARQMSQPNSSASQQAAAQALAQAAQTASQQGLSQSMSQSAQSLDQNQLASAAAQQDQASQTLSNMLQQMNNQQAIAQEILRRQMQQMAQALGRLIEQQKQQVQSVEPMHQQGRLAELDNPAQALRRNTAAVAQQMQQSAELAQAQQQLAQATDAQAQAIESLRKDDPQQTRAAQQQSLAHMENALRRIEEKQQQQAQDEQDEQRNELRQQYEALAQAQAKLREETRALADQSPLDRRQRAQAAALGSREAQLQGDARTLGEQLQGLVVFEHLHKEIDQLAGEAAARLKQGQADEQPIANQQQVQALLQQLAQALAKPPGQPPEFSEGQSSQSGGGGGQTAQPLVPPLAELRLLRNVQQSLYQHTRDFHESLVAQTRRQDITDQQRQQIVTLSHKQRDLAQLGDKLIAQLKQRQPQEPSP